MNQKQKKETKKEKKSYKIQLTKLNLIILITSVLLVIIVLGFYFKYLINKEIMEMRKELNQTLLQSGNNGGTTIIDESATSPVILAKLKESGIERYFLSKVEMMNNHYVPQVYLCLFKDGQPIYPRYVYETWALLNYPNDLMPSIQLIKLVFLPQDNNNFNPSKDCFIKEIRTLNDWQEIGKNYGFSKEQF